MGTFGKSFKKELGKNTGRWVSNKVFGDGHASKHKVTIQRQRERDERRAERETVRAEKEYDKEEKRIERERRREQRELEREEKRQEIEERKNLRLELKEQKEAEKEYKRWLKEQERLEKEQEIEENKKEVEIHNKYIDALQNLHNIPIENFNWNKLVISEQIHPVTTHKFYNYYQSDVLREKMEVFDQLVITSSRMALIHLPLLLADLDHNGDRISQKELELIESFSNQIGMSKSQIDSYFLDHIGKENEEDFKDFVYKESVKVLNQSPFLVKIIATHNCFETAFCSIEDDPENNMSDKEWNWLDELAKDLNIPFSIFRNFDNVEKPEYKIILDSFRIDKKENYEDIPAKRPNDKNFEYSEKYRQEGEAYFDTLKKELKKYYKRTYRDDLFDVDVSPEQELISKIKHLDQVVSEKEDKIISKLFESSKIKSAKEELARLINIRDKKLEEQADIDKKIQWYEKDLQLIDQWKSMLFSEMTDFFLFADGCYEENLEFFKSEYYQHVIASEVLKNNHQAFKEASELVDLIEFLKEYGSDHNLSFTDKEAVVDLFINIEDVVPQEKKSTTKAGVLTVKPFTDSQRNLMIQDYVCSSILRIANELFAYLPIDQVLINAIDNQINSSTGKYEDIIIISSRINKTQFSELRLDRIDPSDALEGFQTNMNFSKSNGFKHVEKLKLKQSRVKKTNQKKETKPSDKKNESTPKTTKTSTSAKDELTIKVDSSMKVIDLITLIKDHFNKDVHVLTPKGNKAGANRKLRALTNTDIKNGVSFTFDKLTKKKLKEFKKETGLILDY